MIVKPHKNMNRPPIILFALVVLSLSLVSAAAPIRLDEQSDEKGAETTRIRTVRCFWLMAAERTANGYALGFAVYVKKLNWFTPVYMAIISLLVKWIIYPAMLRAVMRRWEQTFPHRAAPPRNCVV